MIDGRNLWNAVDLIERAGKEIVAMQSELSGKIIGRLEKAGGESNFKFDTGADVDLLKDGWVCIAWLLQWGLKEETKSEAYIGNLSVQIVLWTEEGERDPCGNIPRVEVVYRGKDEHSTQSPMGAGTWFTPDGWGEYVVTSDGKCVTYAKSEKSLKWNDGVDWHFAVPLFSVNSNEDIDSLIIDPAMELLRGTAPETALEIVPAIKFSIDKNGTLLPREI